MQRVLVTGGSGFIGSHMVARLVECGLQVLNIDIKAPSIDQNHCDWQDINILDQARLTSSIKVFAPDTVIHLAARAEIKSTDLSAFESIHLGTKNLLEACIQAGTIERLINVSTQLVLGPGDQFIADDAYSPYTTYGEAKALAEQAIRDLDPPFEWVILRPTNIWGPHHPSFGASIWRYIKKGYYLHPATDKPVLRCYGYVGNCVDQILSIAQAKKASIDRKTFYLADGLIDSSIWIDAFSTRLRGKACRRIPSQLLHALGYAGDVFERMGLNAPINSGRVFRMTTDYPVPLEPTLALCGAPKIELEAGVIRTVEWLNSQPAK